MARIFELLNFWRAIFDIKKFVKLPVVIHQRRNDCRPKEHDNGLAGMFLECLDENIGKSQILWDELCQCLR